MRYWFPALAAFSFAGSVFALGLGEIEGQAVIGRPLRVTVPILGAPGDTAQTACASLLSEGDDDGYDNIRIRVEGDRLHLSTARGLTQPILRFRIRLGCSGVVDRSFVVLPEPAASAASVPAVGTAMPLPALGDMIRTAPRAVPAAPGQRSIVLMSSTSLRMLSRQRYPGDADVRVSFIRQMAAANSDLFATVEAAFDQRLAAGTRLAMPPGLPAPQRSDAATTSTDAGSSQRARQRQRQTAEPAGSGRPRPSTGGGGGRLIVGAAGLAAAAGGPSTAELSESIDRMIEVMNQQILVQIALTERIRTVEAELAAFRRQASAETVRAAQLESELRAVREKAERSGTMQLLLLILLGGLAGAWALSRMSRRK